MHWHLSLFRKAESTLRVVRAKLDNGERVIGMRYPEVLIPMVSKMLEEQEMIERVRTQQLVSSLVICLLRE